jgi:hypothetical protein
MELHVLNMSRVVHTNGKSSRVNLTSVQQNRTMRSAINFNKSYIHTRTTTLAKAFSKCGNTFQTAFHLLSWKLKSIKNATRSAAPAHTRFSCEPETAFSNLPLRNIKAEHQPSAGFTEALLSF